MRNRVHSSSIHLLLTRSGVMAKQGIPDVLLPSNTFQLLLSDPKAFPGQMRHNPWVCPKVSSQWVMPRKRPKGGANSILIRTSEAPQLAPYGTKEHPADV